MTRSRTATPVRSRNDAIRADHVYLHHQTTEDAPWPQLAAACAILSTEELERHDRLSRTDARRDYALAHALMRTSLSQYFEVDPGIWEFSPDPKGKPVLTTRVNPPVSVSLSHTRGLVACAIATGAEVGVDAERTDITFDPIEVASRFFTRDEQRQLERGTAIERNSRFVDLWTLKEAYAKATGLGIGAGLSRIGFDLNGSAIRLSEPRLNEDWEFRLVDIAPHYRVGIAINGAQSVSWQFSIAPASDGVRPAGRLAASTPNDDLRRSNRRRLEDM